MLRKADAVVGALTMKDRLPRNRYTLRCVEEEFVQSKNSGNPMIHREWEIVLPEVVTVDGKEKEIGGLKVPQYHTIIVMEDGTRNDEKSDKALDRFLTERRNLGLPADEVDDENPPLDVKGMLVDAILSAEEQVARQDPTPEERAQGKKIGQPIKDADGKDIKNYRIRLEQVLGKSSAEIGKGF